MTISQILSIASAIILSLGGGGAIVWAFSNLIGKVLAQRYIERLKGDLHRDLEDFKTRLRKSEFLFQKEFEAASEFIALRRSILPPYRYRDMEWDDACEEIAMSLSDIERRLGNFIMIHGAALRDGALATLHSAIDMASEGKFEVKGDEVTYEGVKLANKLWDELGRVETLLREAVRSQST